jgi:hypothetical protein
VERDFLAERRGRWAPRTAESSSTANTADCRSAASASCSAFPRSGVYRPPSAANDNDLALLRRIEKLFTRMALSWFAADDSDAPRRDVPLIARDAAADAQNGDRASPSDRIRSW